MKFRTEKERREHPQAGLIPYCVWKEYFTSGFPDELCDLLQVSKDDFLTYLDNFWVNKSFHQKRQAWLAFAFSHPNINPLFLQVVAYRLKIDYTNCVKLAFALGNLIYLKLLTTGAPSLKIDPIQQCVKYGHSKLLEYYINSLSEKEIQELIAADDYHLFKYALSRGEVAIVRRLKTSVPKEKIQEIISANNYKVFECAALDNNLDLIVYLSKWLTKAQVQEMIAANNYKILDRAAWKGNLDIIHCLLFSISQEKIEEAIVASSALQYAAREGHTDVLRMLLAHVSVANAQKMIAANNYSAFHHAITFKHVDTQYFLLDFPFVFKYAEFNLREFDECIRSYINKRLNDLRTLKQTYEQTFPAGGFNVPSSEVEKLFHYARYLILRNAPEHQEDLSFLLSIPALKKRAHHSFNGGGLNELIRLAIRLNNKNAYELLLTIPKVQEEAIAQNYYRTEQNDGVDIRELAQQEESSMTLLTRGEQKRLENAMKHYHHLLIGKGTGVIKPFTDELQKRYRAHPAIFLRDDNIPFQLPMEWESFRALLHTFTPTEQDKAYKAYYQHPDHTVLRFLAKPNHWLDPEAIFVVHCLKDPAKKWSVFESFGILIAMLYFAAVDPNITPTDGFTLETRLTYFIHELMLIARAHNRKTRIVIDAKGQPKTEEYDDLQGDNPSCPGAIKRRLLQAVLGHPLLQLLTEDVLEQLLQEFIKNHFQSQINSSNQAALLEELNACVHLEETDCLQLKTLNITCEQQQEFIESLKNKYVKQFDLSLEDYIQKRFRLTENGIDHICHALKFADTISLKSLLTKEMKLQESSTVDLEQAETLPIIQITRTSSGSLINSEEQFNSSSSCLFRAPISRSRQEETSHKEGMNTLC